MACFLVSAAEAAVVKAVEKHEEKKELEAIKTGNVEVAEQKKIPMSRKLRWLTYMLVGGAFLLMFEHVWHGEITAWFPFLTAATPGDAPAMLFEMATVGVGMAVLITGIWVGMCKIADAVLRRPEEAASESAK